MAHYGGIADTAFEIVAAIIILIIGGMVIRALLFH
jgi:hypothetical protein